MNSTPNTLLPPGEHMAAPGHLVAAVTYLELRRADYRPLAQPSCALERITGGAVTRYRALFRAVGEPWLWSSRLTWAPDTLAERLDDPGVEAFALCDAGRDIGLLELDFRPAPDAELAYFGLAPAVVGQGLGRTLMAEAQTRAFARPIARLFVHTCTLDHPRALGFYQAHGFVAYARGVEIMPDPRLAGVLPEDCAPQVPIITPV